MFKAKFRVIQVTDHGNDNVSVTMCASEAKEWTQYTPAGNLTFTCTNPEVNKQLAPGKVFELTFTESEEN